MVKRNNMKDGMDNDKPAIAGKGRNNMVRRKGAAGDGRRVGVSHCPVKQMEKAVSAY